MFQMLLEKDKYEMLVGRKELAARYHKYLNKQIKERRILYVMINVDGTKSSEQRDADPTAPREGGGGDDEGGAAQRIRVKIKSGQSASYLAAALVEKYALARRFLPTIVKTLTEAIEKHEAENAVFEAEAAKVGMLMTASADDSDEEMAGGWGGGGGGRDETPAVGDEYLRDKKRLVRARRLARDFADQRGRIARDLEAFAAAPKARSGGGEPTEAVITELLFERDRHTSIKRQLVEARGRVAEARAERRELEAYRRQLLQKLKVGPGVCEMCLEGGGALSCAVHLHLRSRSTARCFSVTVPATIIPISLV